MGIILKAGDVFVIALPLSAPSHLIAPVVTFGSFTQSQLNLTEQ